MSNKGRFVLRVYGIGIHEGRILVTDEFWYGMPMTKFPGGGLEFGESTLDCLNRECMEELGQEVDVLDHFYTTDIFQQTLFVENMQLISIYYIIKFSNPTAIAANTKPFDFAMKNGNMAPRWIPLENFSDDDLTLPIDKIVAKKVAESQNKYAKAADSRSSAADF
ncbi:MAG TPA: NUDIX hydrolase [Bacteroidales bacterium]|nr:NUDIX hydrolase [Bacteroidales bacterium]